MSGESPEAKEKRLVGTVQIRLLEASNNEAKLNELLGKYLCALLLKAKSDYPAVRTEVRIHHKLHIIIYDTDVRVR